MSIFFIYFIVPEKPQLIGIRKYSMFGWNNLCMHAGKWNRSKLNSG